MNGGFQHELGLAVPTDPAITQPGLLPGAVVQLFLFQGDRYLGWDCFSKDMVLVGGEPTDDLTLDGLRGSGTRLVVYVDGSRIVVHDPSGSGVVRVNDEPTSTRVLSSLDVVTLGSYSLKVRLQAIGAGQPEVAGSAPERPSVEEISAPELEPARAEEVACRDPEPDLPVPAPQPAEAQSPIPPDTPMPESQHPGSSAPTGRCGTTALPDSISPPAGLDDPHALELFHQLVEQAAATTEESPAPGIVKVEFEAPAPEVPAAPEAPAPLPRMAEETEVETPSVPEPVEVPVVVSAPARVPERDAEPATTWAMPIPVYVPDDEPEEGHEEDREAAFSLADLTLWNPTPDSREQVDGSLLRVARTRHGDLLDLTLLDHDQRYRHPALGRRARPVAHRDKAGRSFLTLSRSGAAGEVCLSDGQRVPLEDLFTPDARVSRRKDLYRVELPRGARAQLIVNGEELVLHEVPRRQSPEIPVAPGKKSGLVRNLASSSLMHVLLLMVGSLFLSLPDEPEPPPLETRFVQLDVEQLKPKAPEPPQAKPKPQKPAAPVKVAKTKKAKPTPAKAPKPKTKKTKPGTNPALASNKGKGPGSAAASPKAGGGHGGNARNRNIKKAGILGALGIPDGINLGASQAMAAVTNIDAVATTRSSEAALKVGGIVGSLGAGRVEMPAVGLVNTKGSTQVVVSAGIGGEGSVAALERGTTGETQVRAMVTADIKVPASVSGGMSREEVKRVIDEHMDEVSYCYETALIEDAGLMGRMAFEWKILMSGRVGEVAIQSSSIQSDTLHACIKRAIQTWTFPEPRGAEVLVSYPFVFDVVGF